MARLGATHERLVVEYHPLARAHGRSRARKIGEDEKCLATHFLALGSDNIDYFAICSEEGKQLGPELLLVDFVIEVLDVEGGIGLI